MKLALLLFLAASASAQAAIESGSFSDSCAPWDGPSVAIRFARPPFRDIHVDLWQERLAAPLDLELKANAPANASGLGSADDCRDHTVGCRRIDARIKLAPRGQDVFEGELWLKSSPKPEHLEIRLEKRKGRRLCG